MNDMKLEIAEKLAKNAVPFEKKENDSDKMIEQDPFVSVAESLYHIERTLKCLLALLIDNEGISTHAKEKVDTILGGKDPELFPDE